MRRVAWGALCLAALLIIVVVVARLLRERARTIPIPDESEVELSMDHEGTTYKLYRGDVFKVAPDARHLTFVESLYDPDFFAKNYVVVDGVPNEKRPRDRQARPDQEPI